MAKRKDPHTTPHPDFPGRAMSGRMLPTKKEETKAASTKHPGFKAVQNSIAKKEGVSQKAAGAILAASTRRAGAAAKKKNPNLKKVKGK